MSELTKANPLVEMQSEIAAIDATTPHDVVAEIVTRVDYFKGAAKQLDALLKEALMEYLNEPGKELIIGEARYYIGTKKKVVSGDKGKLLEALLESSGGDFEAVADVLASQPFKHGACRTVLDDKWGDHFTEIVEECVETKKPKKEVKVVNERFVR